MSAIFFIKPLSTNCSNIFIPSPSISIPSFETKCARFLNIFALHSIPIQRATASPSSLTTGAPQTGHTVGITNSLSVPSLFDFITSTTSGITSPCFWITTVSPIFRSFSFIKSSLWSVVFEIVEPATLTGSNIAVGVSAPVLPTWHTISKSFVSFFSGGYLYAIAHFGTL